MTPPTTDPLASVLACLRGIGAIAGVKPTADPIEFATRVEGAVSRFAIDRDALQVRLMKAEAEVKRLARFA